MKRSLSMVLTDVLRSSYVPDAISNVARLLVSMDDSDMPVAFLGLEGSKIEMLFVDASHRGQGIGKQLVAFAIENYAASEVGVNEQNPLAIGFYEHMGFKTYKRTDFDEEGNPYPLLYMCLIK